MQQSNRFMTSLNMIKRAIQWLKMWFWLTDEEKKAAGIYSSSDEQQYG